MPHKGRYTRRVTDATHRQEVIRMTSQVGSSTAPSSSSSPSSPSLPPIPVLPDPPLPALPSIPVLPNPPVPEVAPGIFWVRSVRQPSLRPGAGPLRLAAHLRRTRGPITSLASEDTIIRDGRPKLTWDPMVRTPTMEYSGRFVINIGAWIWDKCPMLYPTFHKGPRDQLLDDLLGALSVYYDFDPTHPEMREFVRIKAMRAYSDWSSACCKEVKINGLDPPIPIEFVHRPDEWDWLISYFKTEDYKKCVNRMQKLVSLRKSSSTLRVLNPSHIGQQR